MRLLIDKDPRPKSQPENAVPIRWPVRRILRCPPLVPPPPAPFSDVIENRRSSRTMSLAPLREVVNLVAYGTRPRFRLANDELERTLRPSPSAGALHAIETVIVDWRTRSRLIRYAPLRHELELLSVGEDQRVRDFIDVIRVLLPLARGTAVVFLADLSRMASIYEDAESLFWRDAGALLQTLFLSATVFRLACCPLGIRGFEIADALSLREQTIATGVCLIGRPTSHR